MDINTWRGVSTLILMVLFLVLVYRVFHKRNKQAFEDAANLPFEGEDASTEIPQAEQKQ